MNKEYINLNENTYAVTNENGNLKVIKTNDEPDMVLKLQNLIEEKQNEKKDIESQKSKKTRKLLIKILIEVLINVMTITGFVCTFPNVKNILCFIGLNVCFKVISKKEINEKINDLNGSALILKELIENLQEEERNLERDYEYKEVKSYENYLHATEENTLSKPMVRKLILK
jgi:hypothetical protein